MHTIARRLPPSTSSIVRRLNRAFARRDRELAWMKVDPDLKSLRSDPRWLPLLRKMRLAG